jgi:hypothetical protein
MRWLGEAYPGLGHMRNPAGFLLLNCALCIGERLLRGDRPNHSTYGTGRC